RAPLPRSHLLSPLFPYTTLFRSSGCSTEEPCSRYTSAANSSIEAIVWICRSASSICSSVAGRTGTSGGSSVVWVTPDTPAGWARSEEHTSELQSRFDLVCRLLLE